MSSWEKFSSEIVEGKKKPALDPVGQEDADINNDGKEDETDSYLKNRRRVRSRIIRKEDYENIEEKAVSKAQQRFFGMVRAAQKGEMEDPSPEVSKAAASMSKSDVKDFAKTKHAKLPEKKETKEETSLVADIVENLRAQRLKRQAKRQERDRRLNAGKAQQFVNDLVKGPNPSRGKSKRVEVKAPANVKASKKVSEKVAKKLQNRADSGGVEGEIAAKMLQKRGTQLTAKQQADLDFKREKEAAIDRRNTERQEDQRASTKARQQEVRRAQNQERTRRKERQEDKAERRKEKAAASKAADRDDFIKKEAEKNYRIAKAKEAEKGAVLPAVKKELGDAIKKAGSRPASDQANTGAQATRVVDTAGDVVGGIARAVKKGIDAKRASKKEVERIEKDDEIRKKAESDAKKAYGKSLRNKAEGDAKKDMKSDDDKFGDNKPKAQGKSGEETLDNLLKDKEGFKDMKDAQKSTDPYPKGKGRSDVVKAKGVGAEGSVRSKGGDVGAEGAKGTKLKGSRDGDRPALPSKESRVGKLARRVAGDAAGKIAKVAADTAISRFRKRNQKALPPPGGVNKPVVQKEKPKETSAKGMSTSDVADRARKDLKFRRQQIDLRQEYEFSDWRSELNESFFLQEIEDIENNGLHSNIKKLIDISKKKNKIEINPALGEGALPVKPIIGSFAQGEAGKGDSNRTMGDVAKRRIRRKLVDWASQKAGEKAEDVVKDILSKKKEGEEVKEGLGLSVARALDKTNPPLGRPSRRRSVSNALKMREIDRDSKRNKKRKFSGRASVAEDTEVKEDWQKVNRKDKTDGLSQKAVDAYRKENPGSKLQTAVTEKKPTGKRADRRKSFCRRMKGMKAKLTSKKTSRDPDSRINKALRRWNCN